MDWHWIPVPSATDVLRRARHDPDLDADLRERVEWLLEECDDEEMQ